MSVAVGDSETMCVGFAVTVVPSWVTGNVSPAGAVEAAGALVVLLLDAQPASASVATASAARAAGMGLDIISSCRRGC